MIFRQPEQVEEQMRKLLTAVSILAISASPALAGNESWQQPTTRVPEPSSVALIGAGIAAFGFVALRRNRREK